MRQLKAPKHKGNCRDAAEEAIKIAGVYQKQRDFENAGFWATVATRSNAFIPTIKLEA